MTDRPEQEPGHGQIVVPAAPDANTSHPADPMAIPGAAGPMGGSPTGELPDGVEQPIKLPGDRPPLTTD